MQFKESTNFLKNTFTSGHLLSQKDFSVAVYHSIKRINSDWEIAAPTNNLFLQRTYLQLLEDNPPTDCHFVYLLFYKNSKPVGIATCQAGNFSAEKSINGTDSKQPPCPFSGITNFVKSFVATRVELKAMVCGNVLLTGENCSGFDEKEVGEERSFLLLREALEIAAKELETKGLSISLTYIKEFGNSNRESAKLLLKNKYHEFTAQPNMILNLREDWKSFDDYLAAMSSKYRVRVRRAFKKGADLKKVDFDEQMIVENLDRIYEMYESVADGSVFNLVKLNPQYFVALKQKLGDDFRMTGYYLEGRLIAFFTTIKNYRELEAHFLGYDKSVNHAHQVYLNILYDIVKIGIEEQAAYINFARTALEIKSSVGAEPQEMFWYLKHKNILANRFLSKIVTILNPEDEWVQRKPFK